MRGYSPHFTREVCKGIHKIEVLLEPSVELGGPDGAFRAGLEEGVLQRCFCYAMVLLQKVSTLHARPRRSLLYGLNERGC